MARVCRSELASFLCDCMSAGQAAANSVTAKTNTTRQKYWKRWSAVTQSARVNPFFNGVPPLERDLVATAFAAQVWSGRFRNGDPIKAAGVKNSPAAISKTIELAEQPSPVYRTENKYQLYIEQMVEGFRRTDPLSVPQLEVPVSVPTMAYDTHLKCGDPMLKRSGCLTLIAFYYLLRVGAYMQPRFFMQNEKRLPATQTKQFAVGNVGFFKDGKVVKQTPASPRSLHQT